MFKQIAVGTFIAILGVAFLPKILAGNMLVLGLGIFLLVGIIALMVI